MKNKILKDLKPIIILFAISATLIAGIIFMTGERGSSTPNLDTKSNEATEPLSSSDELENYDVEITNNMNPIAVMKTSMGEIQLELFEDVMPITAGNFVNLIEKGFYDGTKFHRVIDDFMIQGGDPNTKTDEVLKYGTGGPGYAIPDEHISGKFLTNTRGTISMANSGPDSGGSQFFINLVDNVNLDFDKEPLTSKHPVFGRVISGMDVVDAIGKVETGVTNLPLEDVVVESIAIK